VNSILKLFRNEFANAIRNRWLPFYAGFFLVTTELLIRFGGGSSRALLSLMNIALIFIPLICLVFGLMYLYQSREYIELLLSQPVKRSHLFSGMYAGVAIPLALGFMLGSGIPFVVHLDQDTQSGSILVYIASGGLLTLIFLAFSFWIAYRVEDRVKGLASAIGFWLFLAIVYDGVVLFIANAFSSYPLERPMIGLMMLNPIDLGRVLILLNLDASALMGYTGAVFERFFGSAAGALLISLALLIWIVVPLWRGRKAFMSRDF